MLRRRSSVRRAPVASGRRRLRTARKIGSPPRVSRASSSTSSARPDSGTRCDRPVFVRDPGTLQTPASSSISSHSVPRTSPDRAAVKTMNSNESRTPSPAVDPRTVARALATLPCGGDLKCRDCLPFLGSAAVIAWPAGLSARWPWAMAQRITAPIRCRTRPAVTAFSLQIG